MSKTITIQVWSSERDKHKSAACLASVDIKELITGELTNAFADRKERFEALTIHRGYGIEAGIFGRAEIFDKLELGQLVILDDEDPIPF